MNRWTRTATTMLTCAALVLAGLAMTGCEEEDWPYYTYLISLNEEPGQVADSVAVMQDDMAEIWEFEPLHIFEYTTQGFQVRLPYGIVENIEGYDNVGSIVMDDPDEYAPPDKDQGSPNYGTDEVPEAIGRIGGPAYFDYSGVEVAVVDTGVDLDHPELNVVDGIDIVGDSNGGDDENGHGTHVAGTIGAIDGNDGVVGVAPGVGIVAVRVLDADGGGTVGDIIAGLEWIHTDKPDVRVVNMSLGGAADPSSLPQLQEAIDALEDIGVAVCIAAGNDGADTQGYIPAGFDVGLVVSAYDTDGGDNGYAYFSNYGDEVDIAAPGVNITSTYPSGDWSMLSGTSMAAPHVAGAVAAYVAANPSDGVDAIYNAVINSGETGYSGQGGDHSEPLLDMSSWAQ